MSKIKEAASQVDTPVKLAAAEIKSSHMTCHDVTSDTVPEATISVVLPRFCLWVRQVQVNAGNGSINIDCEGALELKQCHLLIMMAQMCGRILKRR